MRAMIFVLLCSLFIVSHGRRPGSGVLDYDINVIEGKARFLQRIQSNIYDNVVYYHNPKHNDISETHMMQDFTRGLQISCWPELHQCFIGDIDKTLYPDPGTTIQSIGHMWSKGINSMNGDNAHTTHKYWIVNGTEITDFVHLGSHLRDLVTKFNYPLFPISYLPSNAEFITGNFPTNTHKRQMTNTATCSDGSFPSPKYGWTNGRCDYLNFCKYIGVVGGHEKYDCGNNHVVGRQAFTCFCCPNQHTVKTCTDCRQQQFHT
ncbi:Hypothetical predicted protein [Mytilus galloprovincialis]|uniref:Uncharacterized protein n=1 Tax=Mytilus galloprovincialis TaxID=29158 RepID=A0A8B6C7J0_MYTGA|nr:Hypothetical predicted protein [Mytilus galloprovincialis]